MADYYNEIDSYCVAWLQNLIKAKLIAEGDVDSRSITEVSADDIKGYTQCHFFAGIGGWPYALRLAGVSDDQQVWTGSCPCQPFSNAGKRKGFDDERHLWPEFARLIGDCQPPIVFGEQVASKAGREWLSVVRSDLEALGYAVGAADLCAASVGAPHIRQRLWWVAYPECDLREPWRVAKQSAESFGAESFRTHAELGRCGDTSFLANSVGKGLEIEREQSTREEFPASERSGALSGCAREQGSANSGLGFPHSAGPLSRCEAASAAGHWDSVITAGWDDIEWLPCIDGKWRPVKSGIFPLAHGVSGRMVARSSRQQSSAEIPEENWYSRVGALRAFGNAIRPASRSGIHQSSNECSALTDIAHSTRSHARLAPSAAHRWWVCPGSIRKSEGIPESSSIYADEGTAAHELAQHCFENGFDADRFIGRFIDVSAGKFDALLSKPDGDRVFLIDEDMAESVQEYLDYARKVTSKEGVEVKTESYVNLRWIGIAGLDGGTTDLFCYIQPLNELELIDYKHGRGVAVEPQDNKQLLCYTLGVARRYSNRGLAKVRLTVVQPRCPHPQGSIRTWEVDVLDLFDFEDEIRERALATRDPDAPLVAGEHCRFCPASAICEVRQEHILGLAQAEFSALGEMSLPTVNTMGGDELAKVLANAGQIEDWLKRIKEFAYLEATHGRCPPGWKLVAKRATRKWRDEFASRGFLQGKFNLDEADILEVKLRSPAQIEPLLPGKNKAERASLIAEIVAKESSGTTLAPEADKRPAVQVDAASEFGAVE